VMKVLSTKRDVIVDGRIYSSLRLDCELWDDISAHIYAVDVITEYDHEIESNKFSVCFHLLSILILGAAARPAVSYDRKSHGFRVQRKSQVNLRSGCGQARLLRR